MIDKMFNRNAAKALMSRLAEMDVEVDVLLPDPVARQRAYYWAHLATCAYHEVASDQDYVAALATLYLSRYQELGAQMPAPTARAAKTMRYQGEEGLEHVVSFRTAQIRWPYEDREGSWSVPYYIGVWVDGYAVGDVQPTAVNVPVQISEASPPPLIEVAEMAGLSIGDYVNPNHVLADRLTLTRSSLRTSAVFRKLGVSPVDIIALYRKQVRGKGSVA